MNPIGMNNNMMGMNRNMMGMNNNMMGMNNNMMGMNNNMMGMNKQGMGLNNNIMGNNNQMNDNISTRIKIIVEPYEKKIKELEEQLRQKDFEIAVLKEKCFQAENNSFKNNAPGINPMQMGMGMGMGFVMPQPMANMNNINIEPDVINLSFKGAGGENWIINQKCFIDEEFGCIKKRVLKKLNYPSDIQIKFIFNAKNVNEKLTISELGMANNSNIMVINATGIGQNNAIISLRNEDKVEDKITLVFKTSPGLTKLISLDSNISVGLAMRKFLLLMGKEELIDSKEEKIVFLYNANKLSINDKKSLKDRIGGSHASIIVNDVQNIIGA